MTALKPLDVECHACKAKPGKTCVTKGKGEPRARMPHNVRLSAARNGGKFSRQRMMATNLAMRGGAASKTRTRKQIAPNPDVGALNVDVTIGEYVLFA